MQYKFQFAINIVKSTFHDFIDWTLKYKSLFCIPMLK